MSFDVFKKFWEKQSVACFKTSQAHGFWSRSFNMAEKLCLIHSEVSEVMGADRAGNRPSKKIPAFSSCEEEMADVIIRIMELSHEEGWDIPGAIMDKMHYNNTRPVMHGGKKY